MTVEIPLIRFGANPAFGKPGFREAAARSLALEYGIERIDGWRHSLNNYAVIVWGEPGGPFDHTGMD